MSNALLDNTVPTKVAYKAKVALISTLRALSLVKRAV